ncbi:hypothetical protein TNCV_4521131 [Trichonephila clavipes]|nr:hypothetical protein TNCV_4521131 [Trichonephila clavipes]
MKFENFLRTVHQYPLSVSTSALTEHPSFPGMDSMVFQDIRQGTCNWPLQTLQPNASIQNDKRTLCRCGSILSIFPDKNSISRSQNCNPENGLSVTENW